MCQPFVDKHLGLILRHHLPEAEAKTRSFHSFRVGFACALLAAGESYAMIQAAARWRSTHSITIYARLNPTDHADLVDKALAHSASSTSTRNLPRGLVIDAHEIVATFQGAGRVLARRDCDDLDDDDLVAAIDAELH